MQIGEWNQEKEDEGRLALARWVLETPIIMLALCDISCSSQAFHSRILGQANFSPLMYDALTWVRESRMGAIKASR